MADIRTLEWIPKYINIEVNDQPRQRIDASYWNGLWNRVIQQGDNNTAGIADIKNTWDAFVVDTKEYVDQILEDVNGFATKDYVDEAVANIEIPEEELSSLEEYMRGLVEGIVFPTDKSINLVATAFENPFEFDARKYLSPYPTENPGLDGKPVLVLAEDVGGGVVYKFLNLESLSTVEAETITEEELDEIFNTVFPPTTVTVTFTLTGLTDSDGIFSSDTQTVDAGTTWYVWANANGWNCMSQADGVWDPDYDFCVAKEDGTYVSGADLIEAITYKMV